MTLEIVKTSKGKIKGQLMEGYSLFKGIPYAKPPVGGLRWKAPQPLDAWEGEYCADHFPNASMQDGHEPGSFYHKEFYNNPEFIRPVSEDSLYLNVWTPAKDKEEGLPVAIWIHGGAFLGGNGSELEFDGETYSRRGVILVTINYRVNIFGFLAHPWLSKENEKGVSGNYGILDQIAAIRWVHDHIAEFGGDPENITIFGQSAGAMSVQTLVSTELTGDNISKAILQSGGGYDNGLNRDDMTLKHAEELGLQITGMSGIKSLEEFRAMSAEQVFQVYKDAANVLMPQEKGLFMLPAIDGYVLKEGYDQLIRNKKVKDIPYVLGATKDDIFVDPQDAKAGLTSRLLSGCTSWAHMLEDPERKPCYVYEFRRELPGDEAGAFHSAELWYLFGTLARSWRPFDKHDYELSEKMLELWTSFMKTGNPTTEKGEQAWKTCTRKDSFIMIFE